MSKFPTYQDTFENLSVRVNEIIQDKLNPEDRQAALKIVLGAIDLTTLGGDDTTEKVLQLCKQGKSYNNGNYDIPNVAAICVYPVFARTVHQSLKGTDINTACVAGAFPSGQSPINLRLEEVKYAVDLGANEIDMVISRGRLIEGDEQYILDEVSLTKKSCGDVHLKVILETGELGSVDLIRKASELSIDGGADFIKTSTGKINPAATPEAFLIMLDTIKDYYNQTGKMIGVKAAGGISDANEALIYYLLVREVLGEAWLTPSHFRIGASRLADNIYSEIRKGNL